MEKEIFYNPVQERSAKRMPIASNIRGKKETQEAFDQALIDQLEGHIDGMEDELPFILANNVEPDEELDLDKNDRKRQEDLDRALCSFIN
jgi:hypothetical protein